MYTFGSVNFVWIYEVGKVYVCGEAVDYNECVFCCYGYDDCIRGST